MKKTLAFFIAIAAVGASTMPLMAETETVNGYTWTYRINGDTAEIDGSGQARHGGVRNCEMEGVAACRMTIRV